VRVAELIFVGVDCGAIALLTTGLSDMVMFKPTQEARARRGAGERRLSIACLLLVVNAGIGGFAGNPYAAALVLVVALSAFLIASTNPKWMPPLALLAQVPMLVASSVLAVAT
jgi:hypothetical protein